MTGAGADAAIHLDALAVAYGRTWALRDVTAAFPHGTVGLLGPNGAGKSTLIRAVLGLVAPDRGTVRVLGADIRGAGTALRARIGFMPESDAFIPGMTAVSFVAYCGELAGLPRADAMQRAHESLQYVGLGDARYRVVEAASAGMKQRIKLAQALVHDPDLLLLDEPTDGMDPQGRDEMIALIRDIARNGGPSVVVASHLLLDVDAVCDHVVVLDRGRVAAHGPIATLKGHRRRVFELRVAGNGAAFEAALRAGGFDCHPAEGDLLRVYLPDHGGPRDLFAIAAAHGLQVRHLQATVPTLEDVFIEALKREG